jgi:hypothetical protein
MTPPPPKEILGFCEINTPIMPANGRAFYLLQYLIKESNICIIVTVLKSFRDSLNDFVVTEKHV